MCDISKCEENICILLSRVSRFFTMRLPSQKEYEPFRKYATAVSILNYTKSRVNFKVYKVNTTLDLAYVVNSN